MNKKKEEIKKSKGVSLTKKQLNEVSGCRRGPGSTGHYGICPICGAKVPFFNGRVDFSGNHADKCKYHTKGGCIVSGTMILLKDGTAKKVEELSLNDEVLTWNFIKGDYEIQPIIANHIVVEDKEKVVYATFSDNTTIGIVWEHGFFDVTKSKYVFFRDDANKYIGDSFLKRDEEGKNIEVTLTNVIIKEETVSIYSPITNKNLCIFTNGILSVTGGIEGFINAFEVDTKTMKYDKDKMKADINKYGLLSYEKLARYISKRIYDGFNAKYFAVAIGKGMISLDEIKTLALEFADILSNVKTKAA